MVKLVNEEEKIEDLAPLEVRERVIQNPHSTDTTSTSTTENTTRCDGTVKDLSPLESRVSTVNLDKHRLIIVWIFAGIIVLGVLPFFVEAFLPNNEAHFAATMATLRTTYSGMSTYLLAGVTGVIAYYFGSRGKK